LRALRTATSAADLLGPDVDFSVVAQSAGLCERAEEVASTFWSHATELVKNWIDQMQLAFNERPSDVWQPLQALATALTELQALHAIFSGLDDFAQKHYKLQTGISRTWRAPAVTLAIDSVADPVARILNAFEAGSFEMKQDIAILQQRWAELRDTLDPAFNRLFPEVRAIADRAWQFFEKQSTLPLSVATAPVWHIDRAERAFIPEPLLWRFLAAAIQNLGSAAFYGLDQEALRRANATLEVSGLSDDYGREQFAIRISDNGPTFRHGAAATAAPPGHGEGLAAVRTMVEWFDGHLKGPDVDVASGRMFVELVIRK
jgi:hypothetical protein